MSAIDRIVPGLENIPPHMRVRMVAFEVDPGKKPTPGQRKHANHLLNFFTFREMKGTIKWMEIRYPSYDDPTKETFCMVAIGRKSHETLIAGAD